MNIPVNHGPILAVFEGKTVQVYGILWVVSKSIGELGGYELMR
jgi:hypothetical protein